MTIKFQGVDTELYNMLKLDTASSFLKADNLVNLPNKKFDRVLYHLKKDDREDELIIALSERCNKEGLVLVCNIPEINKYFSNGTLKKNKELIPTFLENKGIDRYWFLDRRHTDEHFDLLFEVKC